MRTPGSTLALLLCFTALAGCSKPTATDSSAAAPAAVSAAKPAGDAAPAVQSVAEPRKACELVTAEEMSAILGSAVKATPDEGSSGKTQCTYNAVAGVSPYVELSVEWGEGAAAMHAAGAMNQHEPGIADPYQGIGDQAVSVGPTLMIRTGDDLVGIVFSGVVDAPAAARKIFATAKARF